MGSDFSYHSLLSNNKTPVHTGTGGSSRGTTQLGRLRDPLTPTIIGSPANAGAAVRTTGRKINLTLRSPERLGRELRPVSAGSGSQSAPASPCRLSPGYFPSSLLFDWLACWLLLSAEKGTCQGTVTEGAYRPAPGCPKQALRGTTGLPCTDTPSSRCWGRRQTYSRRREW